MYPSYVSFTFHIITSSFIDITSAIRITQFNLLSIYEPLPVPIVLGSRCPTRPAQLGFDGVSEEGR